LPWAGGFFPAGYTLRHAWYHNLKPNLMANNTLKYLRVDPALRADSRRRWNEPVVWPLALGSIVLVGLLTPAVVMHRRRERSGAR
jgi:hypothetical protein